MKKLLTFLFLIIISQVYPFSDVIILMGPPGSGKGTLSQHLKENYGYNHISCGDLVRSEIDNGTPVGKEVSEIVKKGEFLPSSIMHPLLERAVLNMVEEDKPFIIDGFGRLKEDVDYLHELISKLGLMEKTTGIMLTADPALCRERILHRQICPNCHHVYNLLTAPSKLENICDLCDYPLKKRLNDDLEAIEKRISDYFLSVEYYQKLSIEPYHPLLINTNQSIDTCLGFYSQSAMTRHKEINNSAGY